MIYDYLVLSLRSKDIIATFNWDPFLYQAWLRNNEFTDLPKVCFLHGNVAIGYNDIDKKWGESGVCIQETGNYLEPTKLLFPVNQKNYNDDNFTRSQWEFLKCCLSDNLTRRITIFGYGAPKTDVEAISLMKNAWGNPINRNTEQFEMIDIRPENTLKTLWKDFIYNQHYDYGKNYFDSEMAQFPRRTIERYFHRFKANKPAELFQEPNTIPQNFKTLKDMWKWFKPLIDAENELKTH